MANKSPKQNQELAKKDIEIAALKLEVLTQTEIAKNNKDAYDKIRVMHDDKCHELLKLKGEHATQYEELCAVQHMLVQYQSYVTALKNALGFELKRKNKTELRVAELEKENITLRNLNEKISNKLKSIPNWIRWIFKYVF